MNAPTTLGVFAVALAVVFAGAVAVGDAVAPIRSEPAAHGEGHAQAHVAVEHVLQLETALLPRAVASELAFRVLGAGGQPVTHFTARHEKDLHLIVVRRDGSGYQHLHPVRDAGGRWSTPITLPDPGSYQVFADTSPGGQPLVLVGDVTVPGDYQPRPVAAPSTTAVVDGYSVTLTGDLVAGTSSRLSMSASRNGQPVELEPYLGSYGHLVSLRVGDLDYLHTHPEGNASAISFDVDVPTTGSYLLYLDFQHGGVVRTATFTAVAS